MDDMTTSEQQDFSAWEQSNLVWVTWQRGNRIFIQNLRQISKMSVVEPFHPVNRFLSSYELFPPPPPKKKKNIPIPFIYLNWSFKVPFTNIFSHWCHQQPLNFCINLEKDNSILTSFAYVIFSITNWPAKCAEYRVSCWLTENEIT